MAQRTQILNYMQEHGSITALEAVQELGCMRLAARIADLKDMGYKIKATTVRGTNRFGKHTEYARYELVEEEKHE